MEKKSSMRINILSYEPAGGWILYDYATKLAEAMRPHVAVVDVTHAQAPNYDVTFHVNYWGLRQLQVPGLHCSMVTHIDTPEKFNLVRSQAAAGVLGFCMSEETARRLNTLSGINQFSNFAPPAMMKADRKQLVIMISGRLYDDGRKNEDWAIDFFRCFQPEDLLVRVMGAGWEVRLNELKRDGYKIEYSPNFEQDTYLQWLKSSNYMLYTGNDEGALSTLDALLYGVTPIVTAQGYHLEQNGNIFLYATHEQLISLGKKLQCQLNEENKVRCQMMDWDRFALKHIDCWSEDIKTKNN